MQLPDDFLRHTRQLFGEERFARFIEAMGQEPPVSIRLNPRKAPSCPAGAQGVDWWAGGYYLPERPNFTFDPLLHTGCYYVQEASSMFVGHVLRSLTDKPVLALDLCAAPGGKSTAARTALPAGSVLVSNEPMRQRSQILAENMAKWGWADCWVTNNYPKDFRRAKAVVDVVLCDVPCSGEGMFRKDAEAVAQWSLQNVERCWQLQREIVAEAWQCLAGGGLFIYSTCTYNIKENEENVAWMVDELGAEVASVPISEEWGITGSLLAGLEGPVYRFIPGYTRGEGLFMAVLRKPLSNGIPRQDAGADLARRLRFLDKLNVIFPASEPKDRRANGPSHAEALSVGLEKGKYPQAELDYPTAIAYLRGEAIVLPPETPRGPVVVCFRERPLGFVKNLGSRANNLYPKEWRIKSTHIPAPPQILP